MRFKIYSTIHSTIVMCACVFLLSCATSPTGRSQLILVSDNEMIQMGLRSFQEIKQKTPIEYNHQVNAYVKCVANAITALAQDKTGVRSWEVVVFRDQSANAFALPGGKIGVHTGLLDVAKTQGQLAAVIGHEVGHVIARHGAERVSQTLATQAGLTLVDALTDRNSETHGYMMAGLGVGAQFGVLLPFSRKHESEADEIGIDLMAKAGFDPAESVELWRNMGRASSGAPPEILSTHPANSTRISNLTDHLSSANASYQNAKSSGYRPNCMR